MTGGHVDYKAMLQIVYTVCITDDKDEYFSQVVNGFLFSEIIRHLG